MEQSGLDSLWVQQQLGVPVIKVFNSIFATSLNLPGRPKGDKDRIALAVSGDSAQARVDHEYIRHGVVNIFMANEPLKGKRFVEVTAFKTKKDWAVFVKRIAGEWYPTAKKITW
ncbi:MAG: Mobile element protein [Mucilaginibacter sp.]|nr:Mobile element protein [Mucilaginibacter sp.]